MALYNIGSYVYEYMVVEYNKIYEENDNEMGCGYITIKCAPIIRL